MSADGGWPWSELDLAGPPDDPRDVRRAYARLLKLRDGTEDVASFERLRTAYEAALRLTGQTTARQRATVPAADILAPTEPRPAQAERQDTEAKILPSSEQKLLKSDPRELLFAKLDEHLARDQLDRDAARELHQILASDAMDDPDTCRVVERTLVAQIAQRHPSDAWVRIADRRYGWRGDGVGFTRRFPGSAETLHRIIEAVAQPKVREPVVKFTGRGWIILSLLSVALLGCWLALWLFLVPRMAEAAAKNFDVILTALIVGTSAALVVQAGGWLMARAQHMNRQSPSPSPYLNRLDRWWRRPLGRFRKARLIPAAAVLLSILAITPIVRNMDERSEPWRMTVAANADQLFKSLSIYRPRRPPEDMDTSRLLVPNFVVPQGGGTDPADPYDIAGWKELRHQDRITKVRPEAILSCPTPSDCEMTMRLDLAAVHAVVMEDGRRLTGHLNRPVIKFASDGGGVSASWENVHSRDSEAVETVRFDRAVADGAFAILYVELFAPILIQNSARVPSSHRGNELPLNALDQSIDIVLDWPQDLGDDASCWRHGNVAPLATCNFDEAAIHERQTWRCADATQAEACIWSIKGSYPNADSHFVGESASLDVPETEMGAMLRTLMSRLIAGGEFPPLPDNPESRSLHAQVLRDYALILDQPEAEADRLDGHALRAALSRQPHLYGAMKADADVRQEVWTGFLDRLADLGFRSG